MTRVGLLLILLLACHPADAFYRRIQRAWNNRRQRRFGTRNPVVTAGVDDRPSDNDGGGDEYVSIHFLANANTNYEISTQGSSSSSSTHFWKYLHEKEPRDLLLGGNSPGHAIRDVEHTTQLSEAWKKQSSLMSTTPPVQSDSIITIQGKVPLIPGLSMGITSYMGCKLLRKTRNTMVYEFTLLQDWYEPEGNGPLMWIYHKVTAGGSSTGEDTDLGTRSTHGVYRVTIEWTPQGKIRVNFERNVQVACRLPLALYRLLPFSKERMESMISAAMTKQLEHEVLMGSEKFQAAIESWISSEQS